MTTTVDQKDTCPDCAVQPGQLHEDGCDVARCRLTGGQRLQCSHDGDGCRTVWAGCWPGEVECAELGWWTLWDEQRGWLEATADTPGAMADLNRLSLAAATGELVWDREAERYRLP